MKEIKIGTVFQKKDTHYQDYFILINEKITRKSKNYYLVLNICLEDSIISEEKLLSDYEECVDPKNSIIRYDLNFKYSNYNFETGEYESKLEHNWIKKNVLFVDKDKHLLDFFEIIEITDRENQEVSIAGLWYTQNSINFNLIEYSIGEGSVKDIDYFLRHYRVATLDEKNSFEQLLVGQNLIVNRGLYKNNEKLRGLNDAD